MIKINLLPYRDIEKKEKVVIQLIIMTSAMLMSLIIVAIVHWQVVSYENMRLNEKEALNNEIKELDKKLGQIDKIKEQKSEIERKLTVINDLNTRRIVTTELLYKVAEAIPDNVWLLSIQDKDKELSIEGEAQSASDVSNFMERLAKVGLFSKVNLITLDQTAKGNIKVIKFSLNCPKV